MVAIDLETQDRRKTIDGSEKGKMSHVGMSLMQKKVGELSERHLCGSEEGLILHSFERMPLKETHKRCLT